MSVAKPKTQKVEMSGVIYVKDPHDAGVAAKLRLEVADLKKENKRLMAEYADKKKVIDKIWKDAIRYVRDDVMNEFMDEWDMAEEAADAAYSIGKTVAKAINVKIKQELARVNKMSTPEHFYDEW